MPGKGARSRGQNKRILEMAKRKAAKKARYQAQRDAGKTKRIHAQAVRLGRYGKSQSGYKSFPGTPPNATAQPGTPGTGRGRPAAGYDAATQSWGN